ncbi:ABC-2 type transport system ATP-binding protein [Oceanospirillum multiglobuliferum]|uniref:ABC transporter domain-containing protein n=1 Tax=Oceanospirillum multiglobuliferum TaxID=64969 RepID=A0A1T4PHS6_9GAMM|nr:ATP-binding cassette domain-containing protein [Oceanospirillum multiglobuliferum]OPX55542.1 hypothetical protein BTE48_07920 [Oceanospirillum multiglobuliferum]SJZ91072.1 ABC-2 type transport system ATP-binding protein [Oceanospirillum multiglobuliferum]
MSDKPLYLATSQLSYRYGAKQALHNLDYQIVKGQFNALLGANGAGKSTLFSLLAGLLKPQQGQIICYLNGKPSQLKRPSREYLAQLGVVFQQSTLDPDLSVGQNLLYHAALQGMAPKAAQRSIQVELERLQLFDRLNDPVRTLNGGHKRRVEIARALVHQPQFLMLDEPTVGLDLDTRQQLTAYLHERCQTQGLTVLWTTHLIEEIALEDPVLILHQGQAQHAGTCANLLAQTGANDLKQLLQRTASNSAQEPKL